MRALQWQVIFLLSAPDTKGAPTPFTVVLKLTAGSRNETAYFMCYIMATQMNNWGATGEFGDALHLAVARIQGTQFILGGYEAIHR